MCVAMCSAVFECVEMCIGVYVGLCRRKGVFGVFETVLCQHPF